jgi:hypothetical protein
MGWFNASNSNGDDTTTGIIAENVSDLLPGIRLEELLNITTSTGTILGNPGPLGSTYYCNTANNHYSNVTINGNNYCCNSAIYTINTCGYNYTQQSNTMCVRGDAEFDGDVKIKGVSICEVLSKIESRLAVLVPDPKKLEHFEALKKAYNHYKTLEALCELPIEEEDDS